MMKSTRENLKAAISVINRVTERIATLEAALPAEVSPSHLADALATEKEALMQAEEVRAMCALRILQDAVDAQAQELVKMDDRRREQLESIVGFQRLEFCIRGISRTPDLSRWASAALRLAPDEHLPDTPSISTAAAQWREKFETLTSDPNATV